MLARVREREKNRRGAAPPRTLEGGTRAAAAAAARTHILVEQFAFGLSLSLSLSVEEALSFPRRSHARE